MRLSGPRPGCREQEIIVRWLRGQDESTQQERVWTAACQHVTCCVKSLCAVQKREWTEADSNHSSTFLCLTWGQCWYSKEMILIWCSCFNQLKQLEPCRWAKHKSEPRTVQLCNHCFTQWSAQGAGPLLPPGTVKQVTLSLQETPRPFS